MGLICQACGTLNPPGHRFCGSCGTALASGCPACGFVNPDGHRFCGTCGASLGAAEAPGADHTAVPAGIMPAGARPAGAQPVAERRLVTVLFADIVGFTPFAEEHDAEDVRETLSTYFDAASEIVARYGGTVEKFIGDAVMAVWGTPAVHEDDAERSVRAALDIVAAVPQLWPGISARAGVLTGEAAVTLGAMNQGMVAGDLVNTAARIQSAAEPGTVLVGETTYRAAAQAIAYEPAGSRTLKGKTSPVPVWRALRVVAERRGAGRADALEAPFVGRDDELRLLKDLFHATAREQRARLVSVTGIGGIGKSRLAWEFEKYLDGIIDVVWWHHGRSPAHGEGVTFWPLGEMIRQRAGLAEGDDEATTRAGVGAFLDRLALDPKDRGWIEPALLAVLGFGQPVGPEQLLGAWRTFFERMSTTGTVVLVFEDLHWADSGTLELIDNLLEWSRTSPIYIVTLARPELLDKHPDWAVGRRSFTSLFLEPLPEAAMRQLLAGLAPGMGPKAVDAIVARAEGVPLYAVETVRMLVADGKLTPSDDGRFQPTGDLADLAVPDTLTALIAARLDALEPVDRSLVLDAAVLGQAFPISALAAIGGTDIEVVEAHLRGLVRREVFAHQVDPRSPERGQYAFVQALIREVAYNTLAKRDRKARHLAAARYFESVGTDEIAGALAGHYLAAHGLAAGPDEAAALGAQARIALTAAGGRARVLGANGQAYRLFEQALQVTDEPAERARLQLSAGECASLAVALDAAEALLLDAVTGFRAMGDKRGLARAATALGRRYLLDYRLADARKVAHEAITETGHLRDDPAVLGLDLVLGMLHYLADESGEAIVVLDGLLATAEALDLAPLVAEALAIRGAALCDLGRSYEGIADIDGAIALATELELPMVVMRGISSKALALMILDPRASFNLHLELAELARRVGSTVDRHRALNNCIDGAWDAGAWSFAADTLDRLEAEALSSLDRMFALMERIVLESRRGRSTDVLFARLGALVAEDDSEVTTFLVLQARAERALAVGNLAEAAGHLRQVAAINALNAPAALVDAARLSLLERDVAAARADLEALAATGAHGRMITIHRTAIMAGIAALDGRPDEARAGFRSALDRLATMELPYPEAITGIVAAATLGPDDDLAVVAAARSYEILEGLDARAMLAVLGRVVAGSAASSTSP